MLRVGVGTTSADGGYAPLMIFQKMQDATCLGIVAAMGDGGKAWERDPSSEGAV